MHHHDVLSFYGIHSNFRSVSSFNNFVLSFVCSFIHSLVSWCDGVMVLDDYRVLCLCNVLIVHTGRVPAGLNRNIKSWCTADIEIEV